ncbi:MAG: hypothetical protein MR425_03295 [Lachnospiraceae bacterium]|nr:hypothetical protein [Lachnospiraceae bacterium]
MLDQNTFTETIREVGEIIRTAAEPMSREEILSYFKEMELTKEQEDMVLEFLLTPHEDEAPEPEADSEPETEAEDASATVSVIDEIEQSLKEEKGLAAGDEQKTEKQSGKETECLPDSKMFRMYLEELKGLKTYSDAELQDMYRKLLAGDEKLISEISNAWLPKVLEIAKRLATTAEGFEDVVQEGNMSLFLRLSELCGCSEDLDVEQELEDAVEMAMKSSISELAGEDDSEHAMVGKVTLVNEAKKYLTEENGKEPTIKELSEYTRLSEEELEDILLMIRKAGNPIVSGAQ